MYKKIKYVPLLFLLGLTTSSKAANFIQYVNPFIGTGGHGHTFPGACVPNGMVQLSPDTDTEGWDWVSGYRHTDKTLMGFSHTHLSGTGCGDLGDVLIIPRTGKVITNPGTKAKPFPGSRSHIRFETQKASPGYYSVLLDDFGVKAELTATEHCGIHRYTFPASDSSHIVVYPGIGIPLDSDNTGWSNMKVINDSTVEGWKVSYGWVPDQRVYFVIRFSKAFKNYALSSWRESGNKTENVGWWRKNTNVFGVFNYNTKSNEAIEIKVAISAVSIANAYQNMTTEAPLKNNFDIAKAYAEKLWNDLLSKIEVEGTDKQKQIFYSGLYHAYIQPNNIADVNGEYPLADGKVSTSAVKNTKMYSTFSLWDTYRAAHPLYTILTPELNAAFVESMIVHFENTGLLPIWTLWGQETYCMIGNHAIPIIVDAYLKGTLSPELTARAWNAVYRTSTISSRDSYWELYKKFGYFPQDIVRGESVSKTLEIAFDDWCVAQFAKSLGKKHEYDLFTKRSEFYHNLYDASTHFFRAKDSKGVWRQNFNPLNVKHAEGYTEANAWQYLWYVPHNVPTLVKLLGGKKAFEQKLDSLFALDVPFDGHQADVSGLIGQYAHGNEPSHHVAYLYSYVGRYDKTQAIVRKVMEMQYSNQPDGLSGNEDCGQMSAWYIFSTMGFYPVNPASGRYDLGAPVLKKVTINLPNGKQFIVRNLLKSDNSKVKFVTLNGIKLNDYFITHTQLMNGGELIFR